MYKPLFKKEGKGQIWPSLQAVVFDPCSKKMILLIHSEGDSSLELPPCAKLPTLKAAFLLVMDLPVTKTLIRIFGL